MRRNDFSDQARWSNDLLAWIGSPSRDVFASLAQRGSELSTAVKKLDSDFLSLSSSSCE